MKRNRKVTMKLIAASFLTCAVAAGCANKKNSTSQRASAVPPLNQVVANVPASPPSEPAPVAAPPTAYTPPAPPQPVVYDPAAEQPVMDEPIADASESVAPVTRARPARKASAKTSASASGTKYKVKKGDSLWSIAQAKYGNGNKWKQIAAANPKINPDRVQAGQTITLP